MRWHHPTGPRAPDGVHPRSPSRPASCACSPSGSSTARSASAERWSEAGLALRVAVNLCRARPARAGAARRGRRPARPSTGAARTCSSSRSPRARSWPTPTRASRRSSELRAIGVKRRHRRLRHRLFLARLPEAPAGGELKIDKSFVSNMADRRRRRRDRALHHRPGPQPGPHGGGRGSGDRGGLAELPSSAATRPRATHQPADPREALTAWLADRTVQAPQAALEELTTRGAQPVGIAPVTGVGAAPAGAPPAPRPPAGGRSRP